MSRISIRSTATIYGATLAMLVGQTAGAAEWGYEGISTPSTPATGTPAAAHDHAAPTAPAKTPKGVTQAPAAAPELRAQPAKGLSLAKPATTASPSAPAPAAHTVPTAASGPKLPKGGLPTAMKTPTTTGIPASGSTASGRSRLSNAGNEKRKAVVIAWLEMYESATPEQLTDEQITRIKEFYGALVDKSSPKAEAVLTFWPKLRAYLEKNPDQQENYCSLIYSLLRIRTRPGASTASGATDAAETELIGELLGPVRIAVQGTPPLTEDAVDAYADMACFLYEQKNPGKTISSNENRALFANVITQKYKDAPTAADKAAMCNFPIGWAKFKVLWAGADQETRKVLLSKLTASGVANTAQGPSDPMLAQVLKTWPL